MRGKSHAWLRRRRIAAEASLALAALAAAPPGGAWAHWRFFREIELPPAVAARLAGVVVPQEVYAHAQTSLGDIRVTDDLGAEVPSVHFIRQGSTNSVSLATTLHENSFVPGRYTQLVLDAGGKAPFHNSVQINTNGTDFIEWVRVEASDDARVWRIVQDRAPIFRFAKENREGTQTVPYSENNARYLRVSILDGQKQFPVSSAVVIYKTVDPAERASLVLTASPDSSAPAGETAWRFDSGTPILDIAEVRFNAGPAEFSRNVEISASEDGSEWAPFASGEIYRFHQGDAVQEQLTVSIYAYNDKRYWRVAILNGNDAPLPNAAPAIYITPRHIVFEQQPGRSYRLLYGQSEAKPPQYDLERRLDAKQEIAAVAGQLGPENINPDYSDPRPWTEQHGILLWIALALAVALLGYSALRSLRRSASPPAPGA